MKENKDEVIAVHLKKCLDQVELLIKQNILQIKKKNKVLVNKALLKT